MRVHELAKLLGTTSQKLLDRLQPAGINASNRLSELHSTDIARFREYESAKRQGKKEMENMLRQVFSGFKNAKKK